MSRFVRPETVKLELSAGDWLLVKRRLTAGEERHAFSRILKATAVGEPLALDFEKTGLEKIVAYLLDWSLEDDSGVVVPIRDQPPAAVEAALLNLDPSSFAEIQAAIVAHEAAQHAALEAEKKPGYREQLVADLYLCRVMRWTYWDLLDLPPEVYEVLIDEVRTEGARAAAARDVA